jgi:hypothetical protein
MEKLAGTAILVIGLLFVAYGMSTTSVPDEEAEARSFKIPAWLDRLIQWGIGLLCVWFGFSLLIGNGHFFKGVF